MRKNENKGGRGAGGVILLRVGGNISHVWRVHKERDEKQPPLSKPKERKIKRFENGAHKNTLTPIHRDLTIPNPPLILCFFLIYFLSPGFASFDPNLPFRLYWTFQKLPKQLKHSVLVFVFRGGGRVWIRPWRPYNGPVRSGTGNGGVAVRSVAGMDGAGGRNRAGRWVFWSGISISVYFLGKFCFFLGHAMVICEMWGLVNWIWSWFGGNAEPLWQLGLGGGGEAYPERPDEADCIYYLKTGFCGYGARCRFNHPRDRGGVSLGPPLFVGFELGHIRGVSNFDLFCCDHSIYRGQLVL